MEVSFGYTAYEAEYDGIGSWEIKEDGVLLETVVGADLDREYDPVEHILGVETSNAKATFLIELIAPVAAGEHDCDDFARLVI